MTHAARLNGQSLNRKNNLLPVFKSYNPSVNPEVHRGFGGLLKNRKSRKTR